MFKIFADKQARQFHKFCKIMRRLARSNKTKINEPEIALAQKKLEPFGYSCVRFIYASSQAAHPGIYVWKRNPDAPYRPPYSVYKISDGIYYPLMYYDQEFIDSLEAELNYQRRKNYA